MSAYTVLRICPNCANLHTAQVDAYTGQIYIACPFVPPGHGFHLGGLPAKENIKRLMLEARGN